MFNLTNASLIMFPNDVRDPGILLSSANSTTGLVGELTTAKTLRKCRMPKYKHHRKDFQGIRTHFIVVNYSRKLLKPYVASKWPACRCYIHLKNSFDTSLKYVHVIENGTELPKC